MKQKSNSDVRPGHRGERGQTLIVVAFMLIILLGFGGMVVDFGRIYVGYRQLQTSTDAAAMAGASALPSSSAVSVATTYSGVSGNKNAFPNLANVSMVNDSSGSYPMVKCLSTLKAQGISCDNTTTYNAIQVKQKVTVPMYFGALFGANSITMTASATAAERGATTTPYNIAVIVDSSGSMGTAYSDSCTDPTTGTKYTTRIKCALVGLKILMLNTAPCASSLASCPGGTTNSVDMISVFTFPNATVGTAANIYSNGCGGATSASSYSFPILGATTYAPPNPPTTTATYQITSYLSDYRTSDSATTLNPSSNLTNLLGSVGGTSCAGMQAPGGLNTYYAGAIVAAQSALLQQQALAGRVTSKNAIILLSDGDANSPKMATYDTNGTKVSNTASTYPSTVNECQQAINAAAATTAAGTTIYSVAYGAQTAGGCSTDISGPLAGIDPCTAMKKIASSSSTFFSDYTSIGADIGCTSAQQPSSGLATIFGQIASDFTLARLIPDNTP